MNFNRMRRSIIAAGFVALVCWLPAKAQSDHTFVSVHGVDSASCGSVDAPCRTLTTAIANTNPKGDVIALDSGVYVEGSLGISKSITLTAAAGVHAELSDSEVDVFLSQGVNVRLRNLNMTSSGSAGPGVGIYVSGSNGNVSVENCVISGKYGGIDIISFGGTMHSSIQDTTVKGCDEYGIMFIGQSGVLKASVDHCRVENNGYAQGGVGGNGLTVDTSNVTVRDSVFSSNAYAGVYVEGGAYQVLDHCESSNNQYGTVEQYASDVVTVSNSLVTGNSQTGFAQISGRFYSAGNNIVRQNGTNTSGTITLISGT